MSSPPRRSRVRSTTRRAMCVRRRCESRSGGLGIRGHPIPSGGAQEDLRPGLGGAATAGRVARRPARWLRVRKAVASLLEKGRRGSRVARRGAQWDPRPGASRARAGCRVRCRRNVRARRGAHHADGDDRARRTGCGGAAGPRGCFGRGAPCRRARCDHARRRSRVAWSSGARQLRMGVAAVRPRPPVSRVRPVPAGVRARAVRMRFQELRQSGRPGRRAP